MYPATCWLPALWVEQGQSWMFFAAASLLCSLEKEVRYNHTTSTARCGQLPIKIAARIRVSLVCFIVP